MDCILFLTFLILTASSLISKSLSTNPAKDEPPTDSGSKAGDDKATSDKKLSEMECPSSDLSTAIVSLFNEALKTKASIPIRELKLSFATITEDALITRCDDSHRLYSVELNRKSNVIVTAEGVYSGMCTKFFRNRGMADRPSSSQTFAGANRFKFTFPLRTSFAFANGNIVPSTQQATVSEMKLELQDKENKGKDYFCKTKDDYDGFEMKAEIGKQASYACGSALIDALLKRDSACNDEAAKTKDEIFRKLHSALTKDLTFQFYLFDSKPLDATLAEMQFDVNDLEMPCNSYNRIEYIRLNKPIKISVSGGKQSSCDGLSWVKNRKMRDFGMELTTMLDLNRAEKASQSGKFQSTDYWFKVWDYQMAGQMTEVSKCKRDDWIVTRAKNVINALTTKLSDRLTFLSNY